MNSSKDIMTCDPILSNAYKLGLEIYKQKHGDEFTPFVTCAYRSPKDQLKLYNQGRTTPGKIVTQIKSGGKHNSYPSKAFDIAFKDKAGKLVWDKENFLNFAICVRSTNMSIKWGGDWKTFKDYPHFEI
jgi:peptidoglycan LD-endopeptidase CwlK